MHRFFSLFRQEEGATSMEYAVLVALIGCSVILGATYLGQGVSRPFATMGEQLQTSAQSAGPAATSPGSPEGTGGGGGGVAGDQGAPDGSGSGGTLSNDSGTGGGSDPSGNLSGGNPSDTGQDSPNLNGGDLGEAQEGGQTASGN
jgi:Flp pilus assembly pilin Flp